MGGRSRSGGRGRRSRSRDRDRTRDRSRSPRRSPPRRCSRSRSRSPRRRPPKVPKERVDEFGRPQRPEGRSRSRSRSPIRSRSRSPSNHYEPPNPRFLLQQLLAFDGAKVTVLPDESDRGDRRPKSSRPAPVEGGLARSLSPKDLEDGLWQVSPPSGPSVTAAHHADTCIRKPGALYVRAPDTVRVPHLTIEDSLSRAPTVDGGVSASVSLPQCRGVPEAQGSSPSRGPPLAYAVHAPASGPRACRATVPWLSPLGRALPPFRGYHPSGVPCHRTYVPWHHRWRRAGCVWCCRRRRAVVRCAK